MDVPGIQAKEELNSTSELLTEIMVKSFDEACPMTRGRVNPPWWTKEIEALMKSKEAATFS